MRFSFLVLLALAILSLSGCQKKTPAERLAEAQQLLQERQMALAVIKLEQLVADAPDDPSTLDARLILGQYFLQQMGNAAKAKPYFEEVFRREGPLSDRGATGFMGTLATTARIGGLDEALTLIDKVQTDPSTPKEVSEQLQLTRVEMLSTAGDEERSKQALEVLGKLMLEAETVSIRGQAREQLAQYYRILKDYDQSNAIYESYLARHADDPTSPQLVLAQAINLKSADRADDAKPLFEKGIGLLQAQIEGELDRSERGRLTLTMAQFHDLMGDLVTAEKMMLEVMKDNQGSMLAIQTQFAIGDMWRRHGDFERSREVYKRIVSDNPGTNVAQGAEMELQRTDALEAALKQPAAAEGAAAESTDTLAVETTDTVPTEAAE